MDMPPPPLVVEIVSPGKINADRDYRYKRSQYQARGIREYWIIDPIQQRITVLSMVEGLYEEAVFVGNERIVSIWNQEQSRDIKLTAAEVLSA
jgi:Uma2 family endonuclease